MNGCTNEQNYFIYYFDLKLYINRGKKSTFMKFVEKNYSTLQKILPEVDWNKEKISLKERCYNRIIY